MQRMPILSDSDMSLFELKTRYVRNYLTFAGKNSKDFLLYISGPGVYDSPEVDMELQAIPGKNGDIVRDNAKAGEHPFNDGNGRMSRLLTLLLLYRSGYEVGKYISIEMHIEKTRNVYYDALEEASRNWHEAEDDPTPFIKYMLGVILACYREFEERVNIISETTVIAITKSGKARSVTVKSIGTGDVDGAALSELLDRATAWAQEGLQMDRLISQSARELKRQPVSRLPHLPVKSPDLMFQNLNVSFNVAHFWSLSVIFSRVPSSSM